MNLINEKYDIMHISLIKLISISNTFNIRLDVTFCPIIAHSVRTNNLKMVNPVLSDSHKEN